MQRAAATAAQPTQAEIYDSLFAPSLFQPWGPVVAEAAGVGPGEHVLDVACGTGALTTAVAAAVGADGRTVGLDANPEMLAVARAKPTAIEWRDGRAEDLPFDDGAFDAVVSQFGMMFFDDKPGALREMLRVLKPGGRMAVAVCDGLDRSPGYGAFAGLLGRLFGAAVRDAFAAPFTLGDRAIMAGRARDAGLPQAQVARRHGEVRFASLDDMLSAERACAWTLGGLLDDAQFARLKEAADQELDRFRRADGAVVFDMPALILTARKTQP